MRRRFSTSIWSRQPHRSLPAGIAVAFSQAPLAYAKKSSPGMMLASTVLSSRAGRRPSAPCPVDGGRDTGHHASAAARRISSAAAGT